ncbi:phage tail length tape measure family protein, partial [Escherichia coli]
MSRPDWGALQQEYIAEYTRSGISPVAWCEARGLNYATARRYIKKTPKNAQTEMCKTAQKSAQKKSAQTAQKRNEKSQEKKPVFDAGLNEGDAEEFSFCPDEFGISDQQAKFAMLVAQGKKLTEAYRLAGYEGQGATANSNASRMLRNARVFRAISYFRNQYQKRYTADLDLLVSQLMAIVLADPNQLAQFRRVNCRYCWGENHLYQWRDIAEFDKAAAQASRDGNPEQLNEAKAKGMLSPEMYEELSGKLRAMRSELEVTQSQLSKTGMSAKQTAFAMRMLPAQMTDIVVGLSTGQSPFMVLMQQGGQLKDMFGGIGPAIKGVGSYVLGLINPFTLAAAAVGVLGLAYYKGSQEQDEFNKSLILTGNQLGTTSGQLADIAQRAGNAADSTTGAAAAVLNQLVRSGKVASSSLEQVTTAIVKTSEVTGISTEQLVNDFNEIAKDPVSAISKLNDQYHFLTIATYNQIKALQDEGNQQEAARIATEAYSSSMIQRTNQIKENLGYLETAWKAVADSAKWAWDSMLDIGREASLDQKISDVLRQIDEIEKNTRPGVFGLGGIGDGGAQNKRLARLKQQLGVLQAEKIAQDVLNSSINDYNKRQQEGIELRQRADAFSKQYQTREQQRASELAKLEKLKSQYSKEEYNNFIAQINERYKDPKQP